MDQEYHKFLMALDKADVNVTDWEAEFIESNLDTLIFSEARRTVIKKLMDRYAARIGFK